MQKENDEQRKSEEMTIKKRKIKKNVLKEGKEKNEERKKA